MSDCGCGNPNRVMLTSYIIAREYARLMARNPGELWRENPAHQARFEEGQRLFGEVRWKTQDLLRDLDSFALHCLVPRIIESLRKGEIAL